jgi:tol-pal system protein YbgF
MLRIEEYALLLPLKNKKPRKGCLVMKKISYCFLYITLVLFVSSCASTQLKKSVSELETKNKVIAERIQAQTADIGQLKSSIDDSTSSLQKAQTDSAAENKSLWAKIKELQDTNEKQQKEINALLNKVAQRDEEIKSNRDKIDRFSLRISFLETFLGLGEKDSGDKGKWGSGIEKESPKALSDKYQLYTLAYDLFKDGNYAKARTEFQNFLKNFPSTEYSDNAQFWIGESYYFEGSYEQAILEYEKVGKNYPQGDRVAPALLKRGFAFISMGDKANGKIILQQVIKDYPSTYQSRLAREKLLELK